VIDPLNERAAAMHTVTFEQVAPILPVRDIAVAVAGYEQLGFKSFVYRERTPDGRPFYAFLERNDVHLHLSLADNLDPHTNASAVYIYVDDPDGLFAGWNHAAVQGELRAPEDKPWGMREMSYADPDGNLLRIGRRLVV
jgi:catechol 2,3-dioxygenase-like lactoylglutathione lyase family enzyme